MTPIGTRRLTAAIVTTTVLLSACDGSGDADPGTTVPVTDAAETTTTQGVESVTTTMSTSAVSTDVARTTAPSSTSGSVTTTTAGVPVTTDWTAIVTDIYRQVVELPKEPSVDAVTQLCLPGSPCESERLATVEFLTSGGLHVEGGSEYRIDSVEYQGTLDDVPLDEALEVTLILRITVTLIEESRLVEEDGSVNATLAPDETVTAGEQYSQTVSLGRTSVDAGWQLSALGVLG